MKAHCVVVVGDSQGFTEFAAAEQAAVEEYCRGLYELVRRYMPERDRRVLKLLGDGFAAVYELGPSDTLARRRVIEGCALLQCAYRQAIEAGEGSVFAAVPDRALLPQRLGIGVARGQVFLFSTSSEAGAIEDDFASSYANLADELCELAKGDDYPSHVLVDKTAVLDGADDLLAPVDSQPVFTHRVFGQRDLQTVSAAALQALWDAHVQHATYAQARSEFIDQVVKHNGIPRVLSVEIDKWATPPVAKVHVDMGSYRGRTNAARAVDLRVYCVTERSVDQLLQVGLTPSAREDLQVVVPPAQPRPLVVALLSQCAGHPPDAVSGGQEAVAAWFAAVGAFVGQARRNTGEVAVLYSRF